MNFYEEMRQELLEIKAETEHRLEASDGFGLDMPLASSNSSGELSQYDNHPADASTALYEREKDLTLRQQLKDELRDVNLALKKIDQGTYGTCEVTGQPIPMERLRAIPTAQTIREAIPSHISDYRPVEEDALYHFERQYDTSSDETEYNEQDAYQIVASYNESGMTYDGSSLIDNEDGMGYVEPVEAIASTGLDGYASNGESHFERNIQYDQWMNQENVNEEAEQLEDDEKGVYGE